jgi:hypothetical protein
MKDSSLTTVKPEKRPQEKIPLAVVVQRNRNWLIPFMILSSLFYFSRLFRLQLADHQMVLWWVGFLPNFGASLGGPWLILILLYRMNKLPEDRRLFYKIAAFCIAYLLVYEWLDSTDLRPERVFDWWDVGASIVGTGLSLGLYRWKVGD